MGEEAGTQRREAELQDNSTRNAKVTERKEAINNQALDRNTEE